MSARTGVTFRQVRPEDIPVFARSMRADDRRELVRWTGNDPEYELRRAVELADVTWVGCLPDGTMLSMFGGLATNIVDETGCIWELSTVEVERHMHLFARASRVGMDMVMRALPHVREFSNYVDADYVRAVRWIEWLGGTMSLRDGFRGRMGGLFKCFYIENPHYGEG